MNHQYQALESPSEAPEQQSGYSPEHDKSGQHIAGCLFMNHISEPWPNQNMSYVLTDWYMYGIEENLAPGTWNCPLGPNCVEQFDTFRSIRQYTCPGCQVPASNIGPGQEAALKNTSSMEHFQAHRSTRSHPSALGSSPTASFSSSNISLPRTKELSSPTSYATDKSTSNPEKLDPSIRQNVIGPMKIDTQLPSATRYEMKCGQTGLTSTNTASSFQTEPWSSFSAQDLCSASPWSQLTSPAESPWDRLSCFDAPNMFSSPSTTQTPYDGQHFGGLPSSSIPEDYAISQGHIFSQNIATQMQREGINVDGTLPRLSSGRNTSLDYPDIAQELQDEDDSFPQGWTQTLFDDTSIDSPQDPVPDLTSCTSMLMTGTFVANEVNPSPIASAAAATTSSDRPGSRPSPYKCPECPWQPDEGNRTPAKLRQAMEKHLKRNHRSRDYQCPVCSQSFRNRPDNVKPHVKRKHPAEFLRLYPKKKTVQGGSGYMRLDRAGGGIGKASGGQPAMKRNGRHARSPRG